LTLSDGSCLLWAGSPGKKGVEANSGSGAPTNSKSSGSPEGEPAPATDAASERGVLVYCSVALDLEWSDLPAKPLIVPLVQEIGREGVGAAHGSWWSLAGSRPETPGRSAQIREHTLAFRAVSPKGTAGANDRPEKERAAIAVDASGRTVE